MEHLVCYSGGHSSALVALEVAKKYSSKNLILLNHDISPRVEDADIKRFKREIADYLGVPITYANMEGWETKDQFDVCREIGGFKFGAGQILCTNRIKTVPFDKYLAENFPAKDGACGEVTIYYGFDMSESQRIQRRSSILGQRGYRTDYPLALWKQTIKNTIEIGISPPGTYGIFKHANCVGCLKAGKQHWYIVYCTMPDIWQKAKDTENEIGHSIKRNEYLEDFEPIFERMKRNNVPATEHIPSAKFWKLAKMDGEQLGFDNLPCECIF